MRPHVLQCGHDVSQVGLGAAGGRILLQTNAQNCPTVDVNSGVAGEEDGTGLPGVNHGAGPSQRSQSTTSFDGSGSSGNQSCRSISS